MQNSVQCNACHELTHARVNCKPAHLSHSWLRTPAPPFVGSHAKRESPHVHTHTHTCKPAHLSHSWLRKPAPPFVGSNRWRGSKPHVHTHTHTRVNLRTSAIPGSESLRPRSWDRTQREKAHTYTLTHACVNCKPAHLSHSWLRMPAPPFVGSNRWRGSKPTRTHSHTRVNLRTSAIPGSESLRLRSWDQTGGGGQSPCPQASGRPGKSGTEHQPLG